MCYRSMPRRGVLLIAMLALSSGARAADEPGRLEVGFVPLSVSYVSAEESLTGIQVPAAGSMFLTGERGLYLQWFATQHLALEPQLSYSGLFADEDAFNSLNASVRLNYLVSGPTVHRSTCTGGGRPDVRELRRRRQRTNPTAGGGLGFRQPIRSAGSFRVEAGYERMFGDGWDADTFKVSLGLALRF